MNDKLKKQAKSLGYYPYLPMDIYFSQQVNTKTTESQLEKNGTPISIKKYNVSNIPVKNAMRPIHKMINPDFLY